LWVALSHSAAAARATLLRSTLTTTAWASLGVGCGYDSCDHQRSCEKSIESGYVFHLIFLFTDLLRLLIECVFVMRVL
jgi:hypothetical protein